MKDSNSCRIIIPPQQNTVSFIDDLIPTPHLLQRQLIEGLITDPPESEQTPSNDTKKATIAQALSQALCGMSYFDLRCGRDSHLVSLCSDKQAAYSAPQSAGESSHRPDLAR